MRRLLIISGILVLLDQLTKIFFVGKDIFVTNFFSFTYAENTGAAFGLGQGMNFLFIIISVVVLAGIFYFYKRYPIPLTLLFAGVVGNLIDRVFLGYVRDFISVSVWPIFNFADSFNVIGVILLLYYFYIEEKAYKSKKPNKV